MPAREKQQHQQQHRQRHHVLEAGAEGTIASACSTPSSTPPASAPAALPKPPMIAAIKPLMPNGVPTLKAVYLRRRHQNAGDRAERRRERERDHQHAADRNAEQGGGLAVLRAGAQRAPGAGPGEEQPQQSDHQGAAAEDPEQLVADRDRTDLERAAERELGEGARLVAERSGW